MNILELIRRDSERFDRLDYADELDSAWGRPLGQGFPQHTGRWGDPDDLEDESHLLHSFIVEGNSREISLEELDDRLVVDRWLREIAHG